MNDRKLLFLLSFYFGTIFQWEKSFAQSQYQALKSGSIQLRQMRQDILKNGLKIIFVKDDSLPLLQLVMLTKVGGKEETEEQSGINSLTASLMEEGTKTRSSTRIADELGAIAADFQAIPDEDFTMFSANALSSSSEPLLNLFSDIILHPAFEKKEIERIKSQMVASIKKQKDKPSEFASEQAQVFLFGTHPYGRDRQKMIQPIQKISQSDIISFYKKYYAPNRSVLAVVGKFSVEFESVVRQTFEKWKRQDSLSPSYPQAKLVEQFGIKLFIKKDQKQSEIRLAQLGIPRSHPEYLKLRIANEVLGGGFVGRLNQRIRDDLGLTYSIHSQFDSAKDPGSFIISTFTKNETTKKTIDEILSVFSKFYNEGISDNELLAAKSQIIGQFPRAIETAGGYARNILLLDYFGISLNYLTEFNQNILSIQIGEVNAVIKKFFSPKNFKVVVFGDTQLKEQLKELQPIIEDVH